MLIQYVGTLIHHMLQSSSLSKSCFSVGLYSCFASSISFVLYLSIKNSSSVLSLKDIFHQFCFAFVLICCILSNISFEVGFHFNSVGSFLPLIGSSFHFTKVSSSSPFGCSFSDSGFFSVFHFFSSITSETSYIFCQPFVSILSNLNFVPGIDIKSLSFAVASLASFVHCHLEVILYRTGVSMYASLSEENQRPLFSPISHTFGSSQNISLSYHHLIDSHS